jgi:phosphohistidine phosphatase
VFLIRHADAVSEDVAGSDEDRWLSPRGREAARGLARLLREQQIELDAIVSSPLPRAVQTAELVADGLDYLGPIETWRALAPGAHPRRAAGDLARLGAPGAPSRDPVTRGLGAPGAPSRDPVTRGRGASVAVIGHEPGISSLGALILGLPAFPQLRTAQCCAIEDGAPTFTARADLMTVATLFVA